MAEEGTADMGARALRWHGTFSLAGAWLAGFGSHAPGLTARRVGSGRNLVFSPTFLCSVEGKSLVGLSGCILFNYFPAIT